MARISIITAFYNEQVNLPEFRKRVSAAMEKLDVEYEVVLVDDHSSDGSPQIARKWVNEQLGTKYVRLSRNCGSHAAFTAGLAHATGDCAVLLAADLQDPPESVAQLVERWREGFDVVWATRAGREGEALSTKLLAGAYYQVMRRLALKEMPAAGADFVLLDRKVIDAFNRIPEKNTSFVAMILWMGFRQTFIEYVKQARHAGQSKWSLSKRIKLFVDSVVSFSYVPIRLMSALGMIVSLLGFLYAILVIVNAMSGYPVQGWASLMVVVLVLGGIQLLMLGILGEYLWRAFDESRGRPRYIVEEVLKSSAGPGQPAEREPAQPQPVAERSLDASR
jgi:dolichol-phosphate mannosyltransferase